METEDISSFKQIPVLSRSCKLLVSLHGFFVELLLQILLNMANKLSSNFSHKERTISPVPQVLDRLEEIISHPTPRMHRKLNDSFKSEDNIKESVSLLTNTYTVCQIVV